jgi:hypothetical protein
MYEYLKYFVLKMYKSSLCLKTVYCCDSHPGVREISNFSNLDISKYQLLSIKHTFMRFLGTIFLFWVREYQKVKNHWFIAFQKLRNWHLFCFRVKWKVFKNHSTILHTQGGKLKRIHYPWTFSENISKTNELWYLIPVPFGKRSELQKSQRWKPKRTSKNLETITTSKMAF